jgi:hypothetical protein
MPRTHEDREKHTLVDHRPGGSKIVFAADAWCAIDVAHLATGRVDAGLSTYETLTEKARTSAAKVRNAAVLRSSNGRRVVALLELEGHDAFRHLQAAWGDRRLDAEHHAVAEATSLGLYRVTASAGDVHIDPATTDAYGFEKVAREPDRLRALIALLAPIVAFRGLLLFGSDDATAAALLYRFEHARDLEAFRASAGAIDILGPVDASGDSSFGVRPVKTFA